MDYQSLAFRTAKDMGSLQMNLIHMGLGMASEAGELSETINSAWMGLPFDPNNIIEELGDACWYAAGLCTFLGWKFDDMLLEPGTASDMSTNLPKAVLGRNPVALLLCLSEFAGNVVSIIKAHAIYGKELDATMLERNCALYVTTASLLASIHDLPFDKLVLPYNIDKLATRYPDRYTDAAAIARADKKPSLSLVR